MKIGNSPPFKGVSSDPQNSPAASTAQGAPDKLSLTPGQLLQAKVVEVSGQTSALLDIDGNIISAKTLHPLQPGTTVWLEVKDMGAVPWLTLAGKKAALQEFFRHLLSGGKDLMDAAGKISELATALTDNIDSETLTALRTFSQNLNFTAITGDSRVDRIIAMLFLLQGFNKGGQATLDMARFEHMMQQLQSGEITFDKLKDDLTSLGKVVKSMESQSQINSQHALQNEPAFLLFPCFFAGQAGWGEWLFNFEEPDKQGGSDEFSLNFYLHMSRLGELNLQVTSGKNILRGSFLVENQKVREHLEAHLPELTAILHDHGFSRINFQCRTAKKQMFVEIRDRLLKKEKIHSLALIDLRA